MDIGVVGDAIGVSNPSMSVKKASARSMSSTCMKGVTWMKFDMADLLREISTSVLWRPASERLPTLLLCGGHGPAIRCHVARMFLHGARETVVAIVIADEVEEVALGWDA